MERNTTSLWLVSRPFLGFPYSFDKPLLEHPRTPQLASAWAQAWSHENLNIFIKHWTPTKSPFTFSLRREVTLLLGQVLDHSLDLVMALLRPGHKPAARGPTQPLRYLLALRHRVCLRQRHGINKYWHGSWKSPWIWTPWRWCTPPSATCCTSGPSRSRSANIEYRIQNTYVL